MCYEDYGIVQEHFMYRVFGKYCPIPLFACVFLVFSVVSRIRVEIESGSFGRYCTDVQFNAYTVTKLWMVK